jgi:hypothetical protein
MKTKIFALVVGLAMLALLPLIPAQAATFTLNPFGGSVSIGGLPFQERATHLCDNRCLVACGR